MALGFYIKKNSPNNEVLHQIINNNSSFEVLPETVGQYIGLKDINGIKIFENDLVIYKNRYYIIEYENGCWWIESGDNDLDVHIIGTDISSISLKVTGNKFDKI